MEKISSILPSNARVTSVDLDEAPAARPGAPALGRKQGRNTISDRITLSQRAKDIAAQETMMDRNPKEAARAKKVEELNKRFFETRLSNKPVEEKAPMTEQISDRAMEAAEESPVAAPREELVSKYETKTPQDSRLSIEV